MDYQVKVIRDSISAAQTPIRLSTITATYPRFIHAEVLTHRDRARNSASSRAIPWPKMMAAITQHPVIPIRFGSEQKGMQTGAEIDYPDAAERVWLEARDDAVRHAGHLADLGVHKSICNRLTEPFMWITVVMSATEWANFFRLRCHPDAEIHFQKIAGMIRDALAASIPKLVETGEWHLPFVDDDRDLAEAEGLAFRFHRPLTPAEILCRVSVARCARVSYLTHEGVRDMGKDLELFERLVQGSGFGHWSAHEHVATPSHGELRSGPYRGWSQYRKMFANENVPG